MRRAAGWRLQVSHLSTTIPDNLWRIPILTAYYFTRYANAGGYCHHSDTPNGPTSTVWFSDDQTPRLDWTWAGGNFAASISIRFYCWQRCRCKNNPTRDNATLGLFAFVHGHELTARSDGAMVIQQGPGPHPPGVLGQTHLVLPPQNGPGSPSGSCGASGKEFCPLAWDASVYGEVPRAPPDTTDIVKPAAPSTNETVCGNRCDSPADCASPDGTEYSCNCAFPSSDDAKTLGLDPVAPIAICLALFSSSLKGNSLGGKRGLGSTPSYVNSRGVPHTCRCNATFHGGCVLWVERWDGISVLRKTPLHLRGETHGVKRESATIIDSLRFPYDTRASCQSMLLAFSIACG